MRRAMDGIEMKVKIYCSDDYKKVLENIKNCNFEIHTAPLEETYIVSAGQSNRDYELLRRAMDGIEMKVKIYCSDDYKKVLENIKNCNFEIHTAPLEEFLRALWVSLFVVIPLKIPEISSGQLV
ncbi:unnamed protein product, partial [marine sediment metagenome]